MLFRFSFYYLLARGVPGLINFLAIAIYTRLLTVDDYGRYSTVVAGIGLMQVVFFQWLVLVASRYLPSHREQPAEIMQPLLNLFVAIALCIVICVSAGAIWFVDNAWIKLVLLSLVSLVAYSWFDLNLTIISIRLEPVRYGYCLGVKSVIAVFTGVVMAMLGFGAYSPLLGLLAGIIISYFLFARTLWKNLSVMRWPSRAKILEYGAYGFPLVTTLALGWIIMSSDRLLIAWLLGESAVGHYAVGYDLSDQVIGLLVSIVHLAAYPLVVNKLEDDNKDGAKEQLAENGQLIITVATGAAVLLIGLAPSITALLIGSAFQSSALLIMPWVALSAAIAGIKTYYFDIAFHLSKRSMLLIPTTALSALGNLLLNLFLIKRYGVVGAAWATLVAFILSALMSYIIGRRIFDMPALFPVFGKGLIAGAFVYIGVLFANALSLPSLLTLVVGGICGLSMGLIGMIVTDVAYARKRVSSMFFN